MSDQGKRLIYFLIQLMFSVGQAKNSPLKKTNYFASDKSFTDDFFYPTKFYAGVFSFDKVCVNLAECSKSRSSIFY